MPTVAAWLSIESAGGQRVDGGEVSLSIESAGGPCEPLHDESAGGVIRANR